MLQSADQSVNPIEKGEESLVSDITFKYLPYWPLFLILLLTSLICAWLYLRYTTPIYKASANILIKDEDRGVVESQLTEALNPFGTSKIVENEIVILESKSLMKEVVRNLNLYAPIYQKGLIRSGSVYKNSPVKIEARHPELIREYIDLNFSYNDKTGKIIFKNENVDIGQWVILEGDSIRFIANPNTNTSEIKYPLYFSLFPLNTVTNNLRINASPNGSNSTVVDLSIEDEVPQRGADILNELIQVYNRFAIADKNLLASNTLSFVENRLRFVLNELDSVEGALQRYKSGQKIVDISAQGQQFLQNVGEVDMQLSQISVQLAVLDQVERYVMSSDNTAAIVPSTFGVNDPVLSQLLDRLYELELQNERLRKTTAENNPMIVSIKDQIQRVKPSIIANIRSQRENLLASRINLNRTSSDYNTQLRNIPQKERGLLDISRQQGIKNSIYTFLLEKREEAALSFGSTVADTRIIDAAEPPSRPIKPNRRLIYIIAIFLGLAISIGFVALKEIINNKILFRKEIERYVSWPIVGEILYNDSNLSIVIGEGIRTAIAEQFRSIRSSLTYLGLEGDRKKLLITSSISQEGKSFIALNLSLSIALTNKKVVLLELDLRKPKLSPILEVKKGELGISNYLVRSVSSSEIVRQTQLSKNLFFIPSGPLPPNPSELILNDRMISLLKELETTFDYIIIDSAPVVPVTDSHILSKMCDVTLFVIRHGVTPKEHIKRLEKNNSSMGLKNVNLVFNGVKTRGFGYYGSNYGYGYVENGSYYYSDDRHYKKRGALSLLKKRINKN